MGGVAGAIVMVAAAVGGLASVGLFNNSFGRRLTTSSPLRTLSASATRSVTSLGR